MKDYKMMEAFIRLNQLNIGDVITPQTEADLRLVTGKKLVTEKHEIHFDKNGNAHTLSDIFESVTVDGRNVLSTPTDTSNGGQK